VRGDPASERERGRTVVSAAPVEHDDSPARLVAGGMIAAWERQCRSLAGACMYRHDGVVLALVDSGAPSPNSALVEHDPFDPASAIETVEALCVAHGAPLAFDLAAGAHPELEAALVDAGLSPALHRTGMVATLPPDARAIGSVGSCSGARLRTAVATDLPGLRDLETACFGLPRIVAERLLSEESLAEPGFRTVVAEGVDGSIVAKAHGYVRGGHLGVTGVATLGSARRRGLASALVADLLSRAAAGGANRAWLVSEPGAVGVYLRLGFRSLVEWVSWLRR
jgi:GNAT superfamily N-acetyltransferase